MNGKLLTAFLVVAAMTQGCVIYSDRDGGGGGGANTNIPPPVPGNVTVSWSFAGQTCSDIPQIKSLAITIPGEALQNDGLYPCTAAGYPGITLHDFAPGTYSFTIQALSYSNETMYTGSGTFVVNGDTRVNIDLTPVGGPTSYAYLTWRFPPNQSFNNPTCAQAGITTVEASIDGAPYTPLDCLDGQTSPGVMTPMMEPGMHSISLLAKSANDYVYYRFDGNLQTFNGSPVSGDYAMNWAVGGAALAWSITNGQVAQTCAQAGISNVGINFRDTSGNLLYGVSGDTQPCNALSVTYSFLPPGTYQVFIWGTGSNQAFYTSNEAAPPTITVSAGVFPDGSNPLNVQVFRQ